MNYDYELDAFGLTCTGHIMFKVDQEFKDIPDGSVLKVITTENAIIEDLKSYCKKTGHEFLSYEISPPEYIIYVKK
jgi:TusA-related sulfurtransferase